MKTTLTFVMALLLCVMSGSAQPAQSPARADDGATGEFVPNAINVTGYVGETLETYFDVVNTGTVRFYPLSSFWSNYGFFWVNTDELTDYIQPGETRRVYVTFTPTKPGVFEANFTMNIGGKFPSVHMIGTAIMLGDVNGDAVINISDLVALIEAVLNENEPTMSTDINHDGILTVTDVVSLINYLLNEEWVEVTPEPEPFVDEVIEVYGTPFKMIAVKGGTFQMGGNSLGSDPVHEVTLSDYYIAETEVTQDLWDLVMGYNPSGGGVGQAAPVDNVAWDDCQEFISRLNEITGKNFRMPTEAEWEFAARGGNQSHGYIYSGSNNYDEVAWSEDNSGDVTHAVGSKKCNELGIYDMSGNVWEWCEDWYGDYTSAAQTNPTGPATGDEKVVRGGCMRGHTRFCTVIYRMAYPIPTRRIDVGLRLAM